MVRVPSGDCEGLLEVSRRTSEVSGKVGERLIYLIGSLRNPKVVEITKRLQEAGLDVFSEWFGAGERADDHFKEYHQALGRTYQEALKTDAAKTIFEFDKSHIDAADTVILVAPAGKSGHLELGYALGKGKKGYYLLDDPDRWDLMLQFCTGIYTDLDELITMLKAPKVCSYCLNPHVCFVEIDSHGECIRCGRMLI